MKKILVTGASGFIGKILCDKLLQQGLYVRTLIRRNINGEQDNVNLDLTSDSFPKEICTSIDIVFHLAGKAHALTEVAQDIDDYRRVNTEGTRKLLEAAQQAGVQKFIYFSSVKAVGYCESRPMDENVQMPADTPYGQSKYEAEQLVLHGGYVPHPVVIRPSMVYGNTEKGNLPRMIDAIRKGVFPPLPEVHNKRSMVHVEDVVQAALLAAEKPEAARQVYIVTDGHSYSTRQIYDWIREALGKPSSSLTMPLAWLRTMAKVGDGIGMLRGRRFMFDSDALEKLIGSAWYSSAKIERELGFKPVHNLNSSLPEIVRYLER
ncbi:NAD-dependent epimerase/dehydratase family protein [Methylotuvimicrobium sp. KM1]|uniref:NAD-dependent epimerase/dehydratase family protein n=1 Tax=Methylotuvimicrobium sp. KM1 TaxID=3377707 RepID=UPI00384D7792